MRKISLEEAEAQFLLLIEAALQGEEVIITQENQPIIKLVTLPSPKPPRQPGRGKHLKVSLSDDFDEPLPDFTEYIPQRVQAINCTFPG